LTIPPGVARRSGDHGGGVVSELTEKESRLPVSEHAFAGTGGGGWAFGPKRRKREVKNKRKREKRGPLRSDRGQSKGGG